MNEIKPLFKPRDVVKLKGYPDKNLFWIVVDVVEDGYIFNDGEKCLFDDQHHYEKTNREAINTQPNITDCKITYLSINNEDYADQIEVDLGDNYEYKFEMNRLYIIKKKLKYPKTYDECKEIVGSTFTIVRDSYKLNLFRVFYRLLICRDAYWKIAGEQMGLDKSWEPNWQKTEERKFCIIRRNDNVVTKWETKTIARFLAFPTAEMRDAFYENFKELIEQCKELL